MLIDAQSDLFDLGTPEKPRNPLEAKFWIFHAENPRVYELFHKFTMMWIRKGLPHNSADNVLHRIRWETAITTSAEDIIEGRLLKINNNYSAYYSRLWMRDHPEHKGFFRTRVLLNGETSDRMGEE